MKAYVEGKQKEGRKGGRGGSKITTENKLFALQRESYDFELRANIHISLALY